MTRTIHALVLALAVPLLLATAPGHAEGPAAKVADLAWMTGHWSGPMGSGGTLEENWIAPTGGSIAALVRGTNGGATSMIELIVIEEENGSLVLRVQQWNPGFAPRSPAPQVMRLVESAPNKVGFEATGEGGLKRLGYSRPAPDQFVISIETPQGAKFDLPLAAKK
jgi:Domain of unknown function (DUF6265)